MSSAQHFPAPPDSLEGDLIALLRDDYGLHLRSSVRVAGGHDDNAALWQAIDNAGNAYVVKRSRGSLTAGLVTASYLAEAGVRGIAGPVPTRSGDLWFTVGEEQLAVFGWVAGRVGTDQPLSAKSWRGFGQLLSAIHRSRPTVELKRFLSAETYRPAAVARVEALGARIQGLASTATGRESGDDEELRRQVRSDWKAAADTIAQLTEQAVSVGRELEHRPSANVITHGDCHLFNVVVAADEQVWLLDWVDAGLAPLERDLTFFLHGGILSDAPLSSAAERWFFDGYGPVEIDLGRLAYYQSVRALEDLEWAERALDRHRPVAERNQALSFFRGVLSPTGMVHKALSTAERR